MRTFITAILDTMEQYNTLAGYAISTNEYKNFYSDMAHLEKNCLQVGLSDRFRNISNRVKFLDISKIFSNRAVEGFLKAAEKVEYREKGLDDVARSYIGKTKIEGVSGSNAESLSSSEQLEYCLEDTHLCYELVQKNDFELLQIMSEISQEVGLSFFDCCNGSPTKWWVAKLTSIGYQRPGLDVQRWIEENTTIKDGEEKGVKYLGGYVADPKVGCHLGAVSYDVASMYPTMIDRHNISTEAVNCDCCSNDPKAKVPDEVISEINEYLTGEDSKAKKKEPRPLLDMS